MFLRLGQTGRNWREVGGTYRIGGNVEQPVLVFEVKAVMPLTVHLITGGVAGYGNAA